MAYISMENTINEKEMDSFSEEGDRKTRFLALNWK
jgi:hypothetical protein